MVCSCKNELVYFIFSHCCMTEENSQINQPRESCVHVFAKDFKQEAPKTNRHLSQLSKRPTMYKVPELIKYLSYDDPHLRAS